jgi:hypothetical protein
MPRHIWALHFAGGQGEDLFVRATLETSATSTPWRDAYARASSSGAQSALANGRAGRDNVADAKRPLFNSKGAIAHVDNRQVQMYFDNAGAAVVPKQLVASAAATIASQRLGNPRWCCTAALMTQIRPTPTRPERVWTRCGLRSFAFCARPLKTTPSSSRHPPHTLFVSSQTHSNGRPSPSSSRLLKITPASSACGSTPPPPLSSSPPPCSDFLEWLNRAARRSAAATSSAKTSATSPPPFPHQRLPGAHPKGGVPTFLPWPASATSAAACCPFPSLEPFGTAAWGGGIGSRSWTRPNLPLMSK